MVIDWIPSVPRALDLFEIVVRGVRPENALVGIGKLNGVAGAGPQVTERAETFVQERLLLPAEVK